ncbi:MAG: hypothetical protein JXR96_17005 [Deltaproteobacteria bacterium]|nr:hypothetical protein [Deltaproteobacteria bacterium]
MRSIATVVLALALSTCASPLAMEQRGSPHLQPADEAELQGLLREQAGLEQQVEARLRADPTEAPGSEPDCLEICALVRRICELADRICRIAERHPEALERCQDSRARCARARDRSTGPCACRPS